jgi:hypothetical protein
MAAVGGTLCGSFLLTLAGFAGQITAVMDVLGVTVAISFLGVLIAVPFVFVYGLPVYALLERLRIANCLTAALAGAIPGACLVLWSGSRWVDPALWDGTIIAVFYDRLLARAKGGGCGV